MSADEGFLRLGALSGKGWAHHAGFRLLCLGSGKVGLKTLIELFLGVLQRLD